MADVEPTVLVVEDEKPLAELFEMWLAEDHTVRTVTNGRDALEALDPGLEVVVLDWRMPQVTGEEILAEIRDRELGCAVVVVTGFEPDFDQIDYEIDAALTKPIESDLLISTVEDAISQHVVEG